MVRPVEEDARGILAPQTGLTRFDLERRAPSARVARFVDRYWIATWDLRGRPSHTQRVFAHPVVNVVFTGGEAAVHRVTTGVGERVLAGAGRAIGVMFRPAGFRPLVDEPLSALVDRVLPVGVLPGGDDLAATVAGADTDTAVAAIDGFLEALLPETPQPSEATTAVAERIAADPSVVRVEALAAEEGLSARQLQRRFADHVGLGPKAVVRRYRLYEAAEAARRGPGVDWAALAADLGYSDQAHLTRDFTAVVGLPPSRYARSDAPLPSR